MTKRRSIDATFDSRDDGDRYHVTTQIGDRTITFRQSLPDPFVRATVSVGLWDALRALLRFRPVEVTVIVGADPGLMSDVLELDYNTLIPGSTRREEWDAHVRDLLVITATDDEERP